MEELELLRKELEATKKERDLLLFSHFNLLTKVSDYIDALQQADEKGRMNAYITAYENLGATMMGTSMLLASYEDGVHELIKEHKVELNSFGGLNLISECRREKQPITGLEDFDPKSWLFSI
jgi:hypothetical protein